MVAATSPPDAQLYGTKETNFYLHFSYLTKVKTNIQRPFQLQKLQSNEQNGRWWPSLLLLKFLTQ